MFYFIHFYSTRMNMLPLAIRGIIMIITASRRRSRCLSDTFLNSNTHLELAMHYIYTQIFYIYTNLYCIYSHEG